MTIYDVIKPQWVNSFYVFFLFEYQPTFNVREWSRFIFIYHQINSVNKGLKLRSISEITPGLLISFGWILTQYCLVRSDQRTITEVNVSVFNTLRPKQNGRHFANAIFKCILLNENVWIPIKISLKFVPQGPINNIPALVQIMAWRRTGDKPLSEPMMVSLLTHICVARPQWVNPLKPVQKGHFADDIFKCNLSKKNVCVWFGFPRSLFPQDYLLIRLLQLKKWLGMEHVMRH